MINIAAKKDGSDIPKDPKNIKNLSKKLSFFIAQKTPIGTEIKTANKIDKKAHYGSNE